MSEKKVRKPLWVKITACGFAAVLFSSALIGGMAWYRQDAAKEETLLREASSDSSLVDNDMIAQKKATSALALALAGEPDTANLIENNGRDEIIARYAHSMSEIVSQGNVQLITFVNAKGEAVARIHTPDKFGDDMKARRKTIVAALGSGKLVAGTEPGRTAVSMFASAPVMRDGKIIGIVDTGTSLTNDYFKPLAERIGGQINVHIMVDGKFQRQASTADTALLDEGQLKAAYDGATVREDRAIGDKFYLIEATPFTNFSGKRLACWRSLRT